MHRLTNLSCSGIAKFVLASVLLTAGTQSANSQDAEILKSEVRVFRVERHSGREQLVESNMAEPGDFIVYRLRYENRGQTAIQNFNPTLPIPNPMIYVANTAHPGNVYATTDSRNYAPVPLVRHSKINGVLRKTRIAQSEYRALRWNIGSLEPGQTITVSVRVQLPIPRRTWRDLVA